MFIVRGFYICTVYKIDSYRVAFSAVAFSALTLLVGAGQSGWSGAQPDGQCVCLC